MYVHAVQFVEMLTHHNQNSMLDTYLDEKKNGHTKITE